MRPSVALALAAVATLASLTPAQAQSSTCATDGGCPAWSVSVDGTGFVDTDSFTATKGDTLTITVTNEDGDHDHTLTLSGYQRQTLVTGYDEASIVVQLDQVGTFTLKDSVSGQTRTLTVVACDVQDHADGFCPGTAASSTPAAATSASGRNIPSLATSVQLLALAGLAGIALWGRRCT